MILLWFRKRGIDLKKGKQEQDKKGVAEEEGLAGF
jgi:hypothetical protein